MFCANRRTLGNRVPPLLLTGMILFAGYIPLLPAFLREAHFGIRPQGVGLATVTQESMILLYFRKVNRWRHGMVSRRACPCHVIVAFTCFFFGSALAILPFSTFLELLTLMTVLE